MLPPPLRNLAIPPPRWSFERGNSRLSREGRNKTIMQKRAAALRMPPNAKICFVMLLQHATPKHTTESIEVCLRHWFRLSLGMESKGNHFRHWRGTSPGAIHGPQAEEHDARLLADLRAQETWAWDPMPHPLVGRGALAGFRRAGRYLAVG